MKHTKSGLRATVVGYCELEVAFRNDTVVIDGVGPRIEQVGNGKDGGVRRLQIAGSDGIARS